MRGPRSLFRQVARNRREGRGGEGEGRKEKKEIPRAMTSDEKSKSFAGGGGSTLTGTKKKKKKRRKYRTFEVKMAMKTFGLAFIEPLLLITALFVSFRGLFDFFFFKDIFVVER